MARASSYSENGKRKPWMRCILEIILIGIADEGEGKGGIRISALNHMLEPQLTLCLV